MNFETDVILASREKPVLAVFSASWCGPCRMLKQFLSANTREDHTIVYIDVDKHQDLAMQYNIRSVPTMYLFNIGKAVAGLNGGVSGVQLNNWLDINIPVPFTEIKKDS